MSIRHLGSSGLSVPRGVYSLLLYAQGICRTRVAGADTLIFNRSDHSVPWISKSPSSGGRVDLVKNASIIQSVSRRISPCESTMHTVALVFKALGTERGRNSNHSMHKIPY